MQFRQERRPHRSGQVQRQALGGRPIDIGNALTDMTAGMGKGMKQPDGSVRPEPTMAVENVVQAVVYMDSLPLDANVPFITVMASAMPLMGRG